MKYHVLFEKKAAKALEKIDEPDYSRIKTIVLGLKINPRPFGYIKLKDREGYRIRSGNYRIIYDIIDQILMIKIITIGHRKDIYNQ